MKTYLSVLLGALALCCVSSAFAEPAPDFQVTGNSGKVYKLSELTGKTVVLEWFNGGCPFVKRVYKSGQMQKLQTEYTKKGFVWLTVNSTDPKHQDFLDKAKAAEILAKWKGAASDYIADEKGRTGKLFGAKTTPHLFIIDEKGQFAYKGAFDNYPEAGEDASKLVPYFENALKEVADKRPVTLPETEAYGCGVKYAS